ncbi:MAG: dTDP-glucose 4,6-dehydratase [Candidatus Latescibacteria bacterium]|nr:dTDP-glucose 4,6-dehydratase [bacterium]MBD3425056.1 dTDP-glucose 4,6-dehydratase [Candidatus Latescibacterota bacterium]
MRKMLVTGGAGFIGSNFVKMILDRKSSNRVIVLDKLTYAGNIDNLRGYLSSPHLDFVRGDIGNAQLLDLLVPGVDIIYNFAAETHVDRSILEGGSFVRTDVMGTFTLLQKALEHKVPRFVQVSTDEVYGSIEKGRFLETDPIMPNSPYSASKSGADLLVRAFHKTYGLPVLITRSSNNYGPFQHPEKFIPLFITNALEGKELPLYGDGRNVRDWIFVDDNCRAIDLVGRRGKPGEVYNIGAGAEKENRYIARKILEFTGADSGLLKFVSDRPGHDRRYALNSAKVKALGWKTRTSFLKGLEKTVRWYSKNQRWWKKIKEGSFSEYYDRMYGERLDQAKNRKG